MSANPFLRRVLGEAEEILDDPAAQEQPPISDTGSPAPQQPPESPQPEAPAEVNVSVQELAQMWQGGEQMNVATQLMFTPASYVDFVDLCFIIGQEDGRQLGHLLDELADSEDVPVPTPSEDYSKILQNVASHASERSQHPLPPKI